MKNVLKFAAVSAVAISAVAAAPVTQADAAATEAQPGFYDTADNKFYTAAQFKVLTAQQKGALLTKSGVYLYVSKDLVISGVDATNAKTNADVLAKAVKASDLPAIDFDAIYNGGTETPVGELKVESVSAINAKNIQIKFNKAVDAESLIDNNSTQTKSDDTIIAGVIALSEVGTAPAVDLDNAIASLSADNKTLTLNLDAAEFVNGKYTVTVTDDITDQNGVAIKSYEELVTLTDTVRPTVEGPVYLSNGQVRFNFSEEIDLADDDALEAALSLVDENGDLVDVDTLDLADLAANKKSFTLDTTGLTLNKNNTLKISGVADYAGNVLSPNTVTFTIQNKDVDTEAPEVSKVEVVKPGVAKITFSEKVAVPGTGVLGTFEVDGGGAVDIDVVDGNASIDSTGQVVTVYSSDFTDLVTLEIDAFSDVAGNAGITYTKAIDFKTDTTAPKLTKSEIKTIAGVQYLYLTYDEEVTFDSSVDSNGTYVDKDGVENNVTLTGTDGTLYDPDNDGISNVVRFNLSGYPLGNYTVELESALVADIFANDSSDKEIEFDLTPPNSEVIKPRIVDANNNPADGYSGITNPTLNTIEIEFSEELDAATALNVSNYLVEGNSIFSKAVFTDANRDTVRLTIKPGSINDSVSYAFVIKNVKDRALNTMDTVSTYLTIDDNTKPTVVKAELTATNEITLTFSEVVTANTAGDDFEVFVGGVQYTIDGTNTNTGEHTEDDINATPSNKLVIDLGATNALTSAAIAQGVTVKAASTIDVEDLAGNTLDFSSIEVK